MPYGIRLFALAAVALVLLGPAGGGAGDNKVPAKVNRAIKRGVAYLKQIQANDGTWSYLNSAPEDKKYDGYKGADVGATSLAALTLLECGVPRTDKAVQKAAAAVRPETIKLGSTYALSLAIMFLDRLGYEGDVALIESMTVRLLAGQSQEGTWTYQCPTITNNDAEMTRLTRHVKKHAELISKGKLPKKSAAKRRSERDLPQEIVAQLALINRQGGRQVGMAQLPDDSSNTQFAALALWIARRQGLPVGTALTRLRNFYRATQFPGGGWSYWKPLGRMMMDSSWQRNPTGTMTCAGLLGLSVGEGAIKERAARKNPKRKTRLKLDGTMKRGLGALASCIDAPKGARMGPIPDLGDQAGKSYYFLWSLERVAMIYGFDTLDKKDWYAWGSAILLANQRNDGSWRGKYAGGGADTCFALLFLRRSNLASDLTTALNGSLRPSRKIATLSTGGVGGKALTGGVGRKGKNDKDDHPRKKQPKLVLPAPEDDQETQIARLSAQLVKAPAAKQGGLLEKYQKTKGVVYTEALAGSIPLLKGAVRDKARAALAERLVRMTTGTLRDKLKDDNLEVRRAAARACARRKARVLVPNLIALLADPEPPVARAAHQALKDLTGKDFGPDADATRAERKAALKKWQAWWKRQKDE
jgi:hypothetical protein